MRKCLLVVILALIAVGAAGCIVICLADAAPCASITSEPPSATVCESGAGSGSFPLDGP